jgi:hypothetical protein
MNVHTLRTGAMHITIASFPDPSQFFFKILHTETLVGM